MGASAKTLSRLVDLHQGGFLKNGAAVVELGAQVLDCPEKEGYVRDVIRYFAGQNAALRKAELYSDAEIAQLAHQCLFGKLLTACGFAYSALDIFEAENTTLFDLNVDELEKSQHGKFDLVTNLGTTEHVINQYQSLKTMHQLAKPGGIIYHDVPLAGYYLHGYFSYNPLLFMHLAEANQYKIVMQHYFREEDSKFVPAFMWDNGYSAPDYVNCGIEFIFQKTTSDPFRLPLETSTSLGLARQALGGEASPYAEAHLGQAGTSRHFPPSLNQVTARDMQRELMRRYWRKLAGLFRSR